jgi:hypothetical protein
VAYTSRRLKRRKELKDALRRGDFESVVARAVEDTTVRASVYSLLCDGDTAIRDRAAECLGLIAANDEIDSVREIVRRLVWSMNDEAGSLIPHAPQAIGEILFNVPSLIDEYSEILASFSETEPFGEGVRKALRRISQARSRGRRTPPPSS